MQQNQYTGIFDSHAHYNDRRFLNDQPETIQKIFDSGVAGVINASWDLSSSKDSIRLTERYSEFYCGIGVHPSDAAKVPADYLDQLERLSCADKVVAIGEIGLDYHYDDDCPHDIQQKVFEEQLLLARKLDLPVIIHSREATADTLRLLRQYQPKGVVHCFSGSAETAKEIVQLGMYLGFTGVLTFKNARKTVEAVAAVPLDRLLLETDCPYMAPTPYRGMRCDSSMIAQIAEKMAEIKQIPTQQMIDIAHENTCHLFTKINSIHESDRKVSKNI